MLSPEAPAAASNASRTGRREPSRQGLFAVDDDEQQRATAPRLPQLVRSSGPVGLAAVLGGRYGARAHLWRMHVYDDRSMTSVTPSTIKEMPMTRDAIATTGNTTAQTPRRPPPSSG